MSYGQNYQNIPVLYCIITEAIHQLGRVWHRVAEVCCPSELWSLEAAAVPQINLSTKTGWSLLSDSLHNLILWQSVSAIFTIPLNKREQVHTHARTHTISTKSLSSASAIDRLINPFERQLSNHSLATVTRYSRPVMLWDFATCWCSGHWGWVLIVSVYCGISNLTHLK